MSSVISFLRSNVKFFIGAAAAAIIAVIFANIGGGNANTGLLERGPPASDIPPAEYVYLDGSRVLAYLGQVEGGLSQKDKRTLGITQSVAASLSAGTVAQLNASDQSQQTTENTVSPTVADRFYELLRVLRANKEPAKRNCEPQVLKPRIPWMGTVDARLEGNSETELKRRLNCIGEGNFVRIINPHLYLLPYASVLRRARYALPYVGDFKPRRHAAESPVSSKIATGYGSART